jgi:hypothetical protein
VRQIATMQFWNVFQLQQPTELAHKKGVPEVVGTVRIDQDIVDNFPALDGLPQHINQPKGFVLF